ncbi:MAG TPA: DUF932 domain-containing protein [Nitrospiraceae bacterium]
MAQQEYRGAGVSVAHLNNNPSAIMEAAGMNWKTIQMPLFVHGKTENRMIPGSVANYRSDGQNENGGFLAVVSESYKIHQNAEMVANMCDWASAGSMTITRAGTFDGGTRIWAESVAKVEGQVKKGDLVSLRLLLRSGHDGATASTITANAMRLVCSNGATVSVAGGRARSSHRSRWTEFQSNKARAFVEAAARAFYAHLTEVGKLYETPSNRAINLLYMASVLKPDMIPAIVSKLKNPNGTTLDSILESLDATVAHLNGDLLNQILEHQSSASLVESMIRNSGSRALSEAIIAHDSQPGREFSRDTLADGYNALTFMASHRRGSTEASMFSSDSGEALTQALVVQELLAAR